MAWEGLEISYLEIDGVRQRRTKHRRPVILNWRRRLGKQYAYVCPDCGHCWNEHSNYWHGHSPTYCSQVVGYSHMAGMEDCGCPGGRRVTRTGSKRPRAPRSPRPRLGPRVAGAGPGRACRRS